MTDADGIGLYEWRICRNKFQNAIYNHKSNYFDKKASTSFGKGRSKQSVNLLLKLYPNGLDKDRGSSATLTLDVIGKKNHVLQQIRTIQWPPLL